MVGGSRHLLQPMLQFVAFRFMRLFSVAAPQTKSYMKTTYDCLWFSVWFSKGIRRDRWLCYRKPPPRFFDSPAWLISGNLALGRFQCHTVFTTKLWLRLNVSGSGQGPRPKKKTQTQIQSPKSQLYAVASAVIYISSALLLIGSKLWMPGSQFPCGNFYRSWRVNWNKLWKQLNYYFIHL